MPKCSTWDKPAKSKSNPSIVLLSTTVRPFTVATPLSITTITAHPRCYRRLRRRLIKHRRINASSDSIIPTVSYRPRRPARIQARPVKTLRNSATTNYRHRLIQIYFQELSSRHPHHHHHLLLRLLLRLPHHRHPAIAHKKPTNRLPVINFSLSLSLPH